MGEGTSSDVLVVVFGCIALSLLIVVIGFALHRRGHLKDRRAALIFAVLAIVPLFGAGIAMYLKHQVGMATGETRSGVNEPPSPANPQPG